MPRVLFVDDDPLLCEMVKRILENDGHEVFVADNGRSGVDTAKAEMPDLIIMDLKMPVLNGFRATAKLKKSEETKHIPVLILTAEDQTQNYEAGYDAGADGFLIKPIDFEQLRKKIGEVLG
jgi:twitching motility two-component system response regulator PilH